MSRDNKVVISATIDFEVAISNNYAIEAAREAVTRVEAEHHLRIPKGSLVIVEYPDYEQNGAPIREVFQVDRGKIVQEED